MAEFRIVNTAIDLTRTFLELTRDTTNTLFNEGIGLLDKGEMKLPDIPLVSRPGTPMPSVPSAYRAMPPARMRALSSGFPSQQVALPTPEEAVGVIKIGV